MALLSSERVSVFQILEIPLRLPVEIGETYQKLPQEYYSDAKNEIDTMLGLLSVDEEAEVQNIVAEFDKIKYETVHVATDKIKLEYSERRGQLKSQLLIILPISLKTDFGELDMVIG